MIVRFGGGNDGIAEYLEKGRKSEREYSRDELDHRLILSGDLDITNKIIHSMSNKGQERYLHITLSFAESDVSAENLKAITEEYKNLFMSAYHDDEYSFYAEAHLPKLKNIIDNRTGELVERKPHIHIVIPRTNLVTQKSMNPRGDLTNKATQERLDALQEHINHKYSLISPKDSVRVSDNNYANVLSRVKGDLYREKSSSVKQEILSCLEKENIRSQEHFVKLVAKYGDVKIRNAGKPTEYVSVKINGDSKYTNLKNPVFSKEYIVNRSIPLIKPTLTQIKNRVDSWTTQTSLEIKHIYSKSAKIRERYKSLDKAEKVTFLNQRVKAYDAENKLNVNNEKEAEFISLLPDHALEEQPQERQHTLDRRFAERGIKNIEQSTVLHEALFKQLNLEAENNELALLANIRKNIDPHRFMSAVYYKFHVKPEQHKISGAKDGSPRFSVGKRNLNASDFLTKYLNLSWADTKEFLIKTYTKQLNNEPYNKQLNINKLTAQEAKDRMVSLKQSNKTLRDFVRVEKQNMFNELKEMRKNLSSIPNADRDIAKGILVYKKITTLEILTEIEQQGRNLINQYHLNWNKEKSAMKSIDRLKNYLNRDEENGIMADKPVISLETAVAGQRNVEALRRINVRLKDLVIDKQDGKIVYRDQQTEEPIFTDKGDFIVSGKDPAKEEIGLMLEYSQEKFGGVLKLTGTNEFKQLCALVAAEKRMNVILRPEKYHRMMQETKVELANGKIKQEGEKFEKEVLGAKESTKLDQQKSATPKQRNADMLYFIKFPKDDLNHDIQGFDSLERAVDYRNTVSILNDINKKDSVIYSIPRSIATQKGIMEVQHEAIKVSRHELERIQGRIISEQDGKILEVIDQYEDKFRSESLVFERRAIESELLHHELTFDIATNRLEQKLTEEKALQNEKQGSLPEREH